jgi:hypothetical protein
MVCSIEAKVACLVQKEASLKYVGANEEKLEGKMLANKERLRSQRSITKRYHVQKPCRNGLSMF